MSDGLKWGVQRRLEFIDFRLFWDGRFNRSDLSETFGISPQQASSDIAQYEKLATTNLEYDRGKKAYVRTSEFRPALVGDTIERYLLQLVAIENEWMRPEDTWFAALPPVEIVTLGRRRTDPEILLGLLDAIRSKHEIDVCYTSITGSPEPPRTIAPHALFHSAGAWYVRSWSREHNDFRFYNISRITSVRAVRSSPIDPALDFEWIHELDLILAPNPQLGTDQRAAVATEYGMKDGELRYPCRLALSFFLIVERNLDLQPGQLDANRQQLVLKNHEEVEQAKASARKLSKQALARVIKNAADEE
ncbi:WYL domain-containing protein [Erythrobacter aureus]|uniref:WYL domain-containing protein n=1 Tax=Erythrobacter aureus TaxID=2182384 RepID=UPI003A8F4E88